MQYWLRFKYQDEKQEQISGMALYTQNEYLSFCEAFLDLQKMYADTPFELTYSPKLVMSFKNFDTFASCFEVSVHTDQEDFSYIFAPGIYRAWGIFPYEAMREKNKISRELKRREELHSNGREVYFRLTEKELQGLLFTQACYRHLLETVEASLGEEKKNYEKDLVDVAVECFALDKGEIEDCKLIKDYLTVAAFKYYKTE